MAYSVPEAAVLLGVSESTAWKLVQSGRMNAPKLDRKRMVSDTELARVDKEVLTPRNGMGRRLIMPPRVFAVTLIMTDLEAFRRLLDALPKSGLVYIDS